MGRIARRIPMLAACAGLAVSIAAHGAGTLAIRVEEDGAPVPCRIHLEAADGSFHAPPGAVALRKEDDPHFCALGPVEVAVPAGRTRVRADRGPEYEPAEGEVVVPDGGRAAIVLRLRRWVRMRDDGWTCGDLHVHREIEGMRAILLAEDLNVGTNITVWNGNNAWRNAPPPAEPIVRVDGDHAYSILDAEVERFPACGAVVFLGLRKPLSMDAGPRFPSDADFCRKAREAGAFIDQEKPIWNTAPILAALGLVDSIGIVHNHFHPRDVLTWNPSGIGWDARYSTTKGFAPGTCDLYYKLLDCGLRIPVSAGSASGVMVSPVGYARVYVRTGDRFDYDRFFSCLKEGRSFATNGPMLRLEADGRGIGDCLRAEGPIEVAVDARARSRNPLERMELVAGGEVKEVRRAKEGERDLSASWRIRFERSGWLCLRAFEVAPETERFAHTSPIYVEVRGERVSRAPAAEFYAGWVRKQIASTEKDERFGSEEERGHVIGQYREALRFFEAEARRGS